jgi:hypothetical protein
MSRAVTGVGTPVLLAAGVLGATVALADNVSGNGGSPEWLVPVLIVQGVGVLVNLGVVSWARWSVERIAEGVSQRAIDRHNDRGDAHLAAALPGQKSVHDSLRDVERDVDRLKSDVSEAKRLATMARNPLDSPNPRRLGDPDGFDGRRMRGRQ